MKVAIVCPYDWSHPGGVRTHVAGLAAALSVRGVQAEILAPASRPEPGIVRVGGAVPVPANGSVARLCLSPGALRRIGERLDAGDLDLLHVHEPLVPSVGMLALTRRRMPAVATFHASAGGSLGYALAGPVLRRILDRVDLRIAVSEAARSLVARYFPGDYRVIPNGIDLARFAGAAPDAELLAHKPFVLFVGRPEPRKGLPVLLRAMWRLRARMDVRLVLAGVPAGAEGVDEDWMVPLGTVAPERLPGAYAAADAFAAPSLGGESFGYVLIEAMAAGCPVVASDLPGYRAAAGGAALLATPGHAPALAQALHEVLTDPGRAAQLVGLGRERAAALDWSVLVAEVIDCYRAVLSGRVS